MATADTKRDLHEGAIYEAIFGGEVRVGERDEAPDMAELLEILKQFADSADQQGLRAKLTISLVP